MFKERFSEIWLYLVICAACFFLLPLAAKALPQYGGAIASLCYAANVLVLDVTAFLNGYRQFRWYYPLFAVSLFLLAALAERLYPAAELSAYGLYYLALAYIAAVIGILIGKMRRKG